MVDAPDAIVGVRGATPREASADAMATALGLLQSGFWPAPLYAAGVTPPGRSEPSDGKTPFGPKWGANRNTPESLRSAFADSRVGGVGVCLGPGRAPGGGWLIDLEGDGPRAEESLLRLLDGEVVETIGWGSARGAHALFVAGADFLELLRGAGASEGRGFGAGAWHLDEYPDLEFRVGGYHPDGTVKQAQSACPPTAGPDGTPRRWNGCRSLATLPAAAAENLRTLADARKAAETGVMQWNLHAPAGKRDPEAVAQGALRSACERIAGAVVKTRHTTAFCESRSIGQIVAAGAIGNGEAEAELVRAAMASGLPEGESRRVVADALAIGARTPRDMSKYETSTPKGVAPADYSTASPADLGWVDLEAVEEKPVAWSWPNRFARGEFAMVAGDGGLGKSQLTLAMAAAVSTGGDWPDKCGEAPLGDVAIVAIEDSLSTTIRPRLRAMGADLRRVHPLTPKHVKSRSDGTKDAVYMSLQDRDYWNRALDRWPELLLLVVDPLPSFLGGGVDEARGNDVRGVLEPFIDEIIRPRGISLVGIFHLNKGSGGTPMQRISGSAAYGNLARNVHFVLPDPEDEQRRWFLQEKSNIAPRGLPAIPFHIESRMLESKFGEIEAAVPVFGSPAEGVTAAGLMAGVSRSAKEAIGSDSKQQATKTDACARIVVDYLWQRGLGVQVPWAKMLDVCGVAGFGGKYDENRGRWSNTAMMGRAIDRFNGPEHKPEDLAHLEIRKVVDPFSDKAKAFYLAEISTPPPYKSETT